MWHTCEHYQSAPYYCKVLENQYKWWPFSSNLQLLPALLYLGRPTLKIQIFFCTNSFFKNVSTSYYILVSTYNLPTYLPSYSVLTYCLLTCCCCWAGWKRGRHSFLTFFSTLSNTPTFHNIKFLQRWGSSILVGIQQLAFLSEDRKGSGCKTH